VMSVL